MPPTKTYIGALVRLRWDIETRGGTKFRKGLVMRCIDSTSSGLELRCYKRGWGNGIRSVSKSSVEVIEWPSKED